MRLLSASATAAIITFVLLATLGGTAALAQEQSTRQAFQTREITGQEATPENTTQTPASEQRDAQASAGCPGARVIDTVGPTDDDLLIGPIRISGKSFRLTYETTDVDQSGIPFFDVTVLDAAGNEVGGRVIFKEGIQREIVRSGPGNFTIEARSEDLKYKLTAEDCTGGANPSPPNPPPGGSGGDVPSDQYNNVDDPGDVVDDTTSDRPLPNTGGVPLLGFFGFVCAFAAFALLRPVIRRDP